MIRDSFSSDLSDYIDSSSLRDAILAIKNRISQEFPAFTPQVDEAEQTYKYLLHYMTEGYADPSRDSQLLSIKEKLHRLADRMMVESEVKESPLEWYSTMRLRNLRGDNLTTLFDRYRELHEDLSGLYSVGAPSEATSDRQYQLDNYLCDIFDEIRIRYHLSRSDRALISRYISDPSIGSALPRIILSAIVVSSLFIYDETKFELLTEIVPDNNIAIPLRAIAMVGVFLIFSQHPKRAALYGKTRQRIELWKDDDSIMTMLHTVAKILIRTADTDNVRKTMDEDVIPRIMKMGPDIVRKMRDASVTSDVSAFEENPEWAEMFEQTGIRKKLEELSELQSEGADLMIAAFSNLKNFPFFKTPANWFLPFNPNHSALSGFRKMDLSGVGELFESTLMMSDSDKFSFALAIDRIPRQQLEAMSTAMNQQFEQMRDEKNSSLQLNTDSVIATETRRFVRNLYRFTKLFRDGRQVPDCFARTIDLSSLGLLWDVMANEELIELAAAYYFSRRLYSQALPLLRMADTDPSRKLKEQIGYCLENMNLKDEAMHAYEKALLVNPDSRWLIRRMAILLTSGNNPNFHRAIELYKKLVEKDPDNEKLLSNISDLLCKTEQYTYALKYLYKLNYLYPQNSYAPSAIAWAELKSGNLEKAKECFNHLLISEPDYKSYVGSGHISLILGNIKDAIGFYKESINLSSVQKFKEEMSLINQFMGNNGIPSSLIELVSDKVLYDSCSE